MRVAFVRTPRNRNSIAVLMRVLVPLGNGGRLEVAAYDAPPCDLSSADILAFSFTTVDLDEAVSRIAPFARAPHRPLLIAGGPHPSADPEGTLRLGFDAVFTGEAERTLPAFVASWAADPDVRRVVREPVIAAFGQPFDLDSAPHADGTTSEFPFVEISRGCPHSCAFCQVPATFGRKVRFRGPATILAGVAHAVARGHRRIRFLASDAFSYGGGPPEAVAAALDGLLGSCRAAGALFPMLGSFPAEVRPDRVRAELLAVVARHCANRTVVVGAQSGSDAALTLMLRGHCVEDNRRAVRLVAEAGLVPHVDLLFGFPGETREDRLASLDLAREVLGLPESRLHLHAYLPLPGAPAWPALPEPIEPEVVATLRALKDTGRVDGYWDQQVAQGRRVAELLRSGLISAKPWRQL
ncbi:MAG: TIGR04013 family B12-binding domain/radical SAM domain-containing protein [Deltaproteobacteria bacterium]|nr:TIGR04013 family B12-binding domain/radical SAM domain-containing protein [Deltaproteobacteria bacterium]